MSSSERTMNPDQTAPSGPRDNVTFSILDTDLYKITMQQAVLQNFPTSQVTYRFTNRVKGMLFTRESLDWIEQGAARLSELKLSQEEAEWLHATCPYLQPAYISYLKSCRLKPSEQLAIHFIPASPEGSTVEKGYIEIEVRGLWVETILYEVPLMAILSEAYFACVDTDWTYAGQEELAFQKAETLIKNGAAFSDFGTRRRRSYRSQDIVVGGLKRAHDQFEGLPGHGRLVGTSNLHFAQKYGLLPIGTIAHEWIMGIAALNGYENANSLALDLWETVYPPTPSNALHIALTDTFSSEPFFKNFKSNVDLAKRWRGLRQDSGDPIIYALRAKEVYQEMGIDWKEKMIVFSDGLDVKKAVNITKRCADIGFIASFGIGTFFTNDFSNSQGERSKPLNIVIKLAEVDGKPCVKISDEVSKNTGDPLTVKLVKETFGLDEKKIRHGYR